MNKIEVNRKNALVLLLGKVNLKLLKEMLLVNNNSSLKALRVSNKRGNKIKINSMIKISSTIRTSSTIKTSSMIKITIKTTIKIMIRTTIKIKIMIKTSSMTKTMIIIIIIIKKSLSNEDVDQMI